MPHIYTAKSQRWLLVCPPIRGRIQHHEVAHGMNTGINSKVIDMIRIHTSYSIRWPYSCITSAYMNIDHDPTSQNRPRWKTTYIFGMGVYQLLMIGHATVHPVSHPQVLVRYGWFAIRTIFIWRMLQMMLLIKILNPLMT